MLITVKNLTGVIWTVLFAITFNAYMPYNSVSKQEQRHMKQMLLLALFFIVEFSLIFTDYITAGLTCGAIGVAIGIWTIVHNNLQDT